MTNLKLEAAIIAVNENRKISKNIIASAKEQLTPYIGKQIFKVDGSLLSKINFNIDIIEDRKIGEYHVSTSFYFENKYNNFRVVVSTRVVGHPDKNNVCKIHQRQEDFFYILDLEGQNVKGINQSDISYLDNVLDMEKVLLAASKVESMKKAYEMAVSEVPTELREVLNINHIR